MKRYIRYISAMSLVLLLLFTSCKKFLAGDVNINPNRASNVSLNTLLPAVLESTSSNHYQVGTRTSIFAQQLAAYTSGPFDDDQNRNVRMATAFQELYQNALSNLDYLVDKATTDNAPHYAGIGKILQTINLGMATDVWGSVPFSEAFEGTANLYPGYDDQQAVYPLLQKNLDEAIALLQQPPGTIRPRNDDLIYQGSALKWIKTANVLKARLAMHLTKKGAAAAANQALGFFANAYANNTEDMQLIYNDRNLNPWHRNVSVLLKSGNFRVAPSVKFVDAMNGTIYPGLVDPRLPFLMFKAPANPWRGMQNGAGTGSLVDLTDATYYTKPSSPMIMVSYAEQKFLEAEARFLANGGSVTSTGSTDEAYNAYIGGITAHMDKVGVAAGDKSAYLGNALVAVTPAGLTLELIMKEKFIATYLHPETWVDVRRYDYNANIYKGMALPLGQDPAMNGQFIRRVMYPLDEINRNPKASAAEKKLTDKVWWDQ
ncbi:MAG: SusD/RagB family nutrient-binding outer membrane lipoprotein [Chitinophagaceae bacterium]